jgi:hypothetical protein
MVSSIEQIQKGVREYVEREIASQATGFRKFAVHFIIPQIDKYTSDYLMKFKNIIPDMFDANGNVRLEEVYNNAKRAIQQSGQFEFMGIIFNETDVDKLYYYINGGIV